MSAVGRFLRKLARRSREAVSPGIALEPLPGVHGLRVSGELDLATVDTMRAALAPEMQGTLVLDLSDLHFIDDSGLGLLIGSAKRLAEAGGSLVLRNLRPEILRVFEMTGLTRSTVLRIEADPTDPS